MKYFKAQLKGSTTILLSAEEVEMGKEYISNVKEATEADLEGQIMIPYGSKSSLLMAFRSLGVKTS